MVAITLLGLAVILTIISMRWVNILFSIIASGSWFLALAYTRSVPFSGIATGSTADEMLVIVLAGAGIGTLIYGVQRQLRTNASFGGKEFDVKDAKEEIKNIIHSKQTRDTDVKENPDDYTVRVRAALARGKKIKR